MTFNAKVTAAFLAAVTFVSVAYAAHLAGQIGTVAVSEIDYQSAVLVAVIGWAVLWVVAIVVITIHAALTERRHDVDAEDERDELINLRGDRVSYQVLGFGIVIALGLVMVEAEYFWIAQALLVVAVMAAIARSIAVLAYYRRGF